MSKVIYSAFNFFLFFFIQGNHLLFDWHLQFYDIPNRIQCNQNLKILNGDTLVSGNNTDLELLNYNNIYNFLQDETKN